MSLKEIYRPNSESDYTGTYNWTSTYTPQVGGGKTVSTFVTDSGSESHLCSDNILINYNDTSDPPVSRPLSNSTGWAFNHGFHGFQDPTGNKQYCYPAAPNEIFTGNPDDYVEHPNYLQRIVASIPVDSTGGGSCISVVNGRVATVTGTSCTGGVGNNVHIKQIAVAEDHVCALAQDGAVTCWGNNDYYQLGTDLMINPAHTPAGVSVATTGTTGTEVDLEARLTQEAVTNRCDFTGTGTNAPIPATTKDIGYLSAFSVSPAAIPGYEKTCNGNYPTVVYENNPVSLLSPSGPHPVSIAVAGGFVGDLSGVDVYNGASMHGSTWIAYNKAIQATTGTTPAVPGDATPLLHKSAVPIRPAVPAKNISGFGSDLAGSMSQTSPPGVTESPMSRNFALTSPSTTPELQQISAAIGLTCFVTKGTATAPTSVADNQVYCFGRNDAGQLGADLPVTPAAPGAFVGSKAPVAVRYEDAPGSVAPLKGVLKVVAGGSSLNQSPKDIVGACALVVSGDVYCWGNNTYNQLNQTQTPYSNIAVKIQGLRTNAAGAADRLTVRDISYNGDHACAILSDGGSSSFVKCWGNNMSYAQGGDYTLVASGVPPAFVPAEDENGGSILTGTSTKWAPTQALDSATQPPFDPTVNFIVTAGNLHRGFTCVIDDATYSDINVNNNEVWCWGANPNLDPPANSPGYNSNIYSNSYHAPMKIPLLKGVSTLSASSNQVCGLKTTGGGAILCIRYSELFGDFDPADYAGTQ